MQLLLLIKNVIDKIKTRSINRAPSEQERHRCICYSLQEKKTLLDTSRKEGIGRPKIVTMRKNPYLKHKKTNSQYESDEETTSPKTIPMLQSGEYYAQAAKSKWKK